MHRGSNKWKRVTPLNAYNYDLFFKNEFKQLENFVRSISCHQAKPIPVFNEYFLFIWFVVNYKSNFINHIFFYLKASHWFFHRRVRHWQIHLLHARISRIRQPKQQENYLRAGKWSFNLIYKIWATACF